MIYKPEHKFYVGDAIHCRQAVHQRPVCFLGRMGRNIFGLFTGDHQEVFLSSFEVPDRNFQLGGPDYVTAQEVHDYMMCEGAAFYILELAETPTYKIGDRFEKVWVKDGGEEVSKGTAILAQVGDGEVVLINLETGNRLRRPWPVENASKITEEEMSHIRGKFKLTKL